MNHEVPKEKRKIAITPEMNHEVPIERRKIGVTPEMNHKLPVVQRLPKSSKLSVIGPPCIQNRPITIEIERIDMYNSPSQNAWALVSEIGNTFLWFWKVVGSFLSLTNCSKWLSREQVLWNLLDWCSFQFINCMIREISGAKFAEVSEDETFSQTSKTSVSKFRSWHKSTKRGRRIEFPWLAVQSYLRVSNLLRTR